MNKFFMLLTLLVATFLVGCRVDQPSKMTYEVRFLNLITASTDGVNYTPTVLRNGVRLWPVVHIKPLSYYRYSGWYTSTTGIQAVQVGDTDGNWITSSGPIVDSRTWGGKKITVVLIGPKENFTHEVIEE